MNTKDKEIRMEKFQKLLFFMGILILLLTLGFWAWQIYIKSGAEQLRTVNEYAKYEGEKYYSEVLYDGDVYEYDEECINLLILGVDGRGEAQLNEAIGFGPKADSIYLAVLKPSNASLRLINISRDAVTAIQLYDSLGQDIGIHPMQLGMQYSVGDGLEESCELMEAAVSNLLGDIPIHGYCALYWNGIMEVHDAVGPVTVEVPEYLAQLDFETFPESGMTELNAEQAKIFVQCRDIDVTGSDELRVERQKEYFQALYDAGKEKIGESPFAVLGVKKKIEPYLVSDLTAHEILTLANWITQWSLRDLYIENIPGKIAETAFQDEYIIEQDALQEMLIKIFYNKRY